jgi:glutamate synthase domain-containing protein 3
MTGGAAFVLDESGGARRRINRQLVAVEAPDLEETYRVRAWVARHAQFTGSRRARAILADWLRFSTYILKIVPKDQPKRSEPPPVAAAPVVAEAPVAVPA